MSNAEYTESLFTVARHFQQVRDNASDPATAQAAHRKYVTCVVDYSKTTGTSLGDVARAVTTANDNAAK